MSNRSDARRDATRVIVAAMQTGNLPWAANTPKNQKLDLLRGYINTLATQFIEDDDGQQADSSSTDSNSASSFAG